MKTYSYETWDIPKLKDAGLGIGVYYIFHGGHIKALDCLKFCHGVKDIVAGVVSASYKIESGVPYKDILSVNGMITLSWLHGINKSVILPENIEESSELILEKQPTAVAINTDAIYDIENDGKCNEFEETFFGLMTDGKTEGFDNVRFNLDFIRDSAVEFQKTFRQLQRLYKENIPKSELKKLNEKRHLSFPIIPFTYVDEDGVPTKFIGDTSMYSKTLAKMPEILFIEPQGGYVTSHKNGIEIRRTFNARKIYEAVMNMLHDPEVEINPEAPDVHFYEHLLGEKILLKKSLVFKSVYETHSEFPHFVVGLQNNKKFPYPFNRETFSLPFNILRSRNIN